MTSSTGVDALLEVLRTEGVTHIFGNPGSTELPLIDALATAPDLHYALALQEATAVGMADGYAQVTGRPAFLNLHTSAGLGNAIGNLTNAQANRTPLVVTAGQQDTRHLVADPLLSGDLVGIARATAKWTHEVRSADEVAPVIRRAFHDAVSAPGGPVFVSLPMDLLERDVTAPVPAPSRIERACVGAGLEELAELLASAPIGRLGIVVGDEVSAAHAGDAAVALAEALGAPVHGASLHATGVFPQTHGLYQGTFAPAAPAIAAGLAPYQRVLVLGSHTFMVYPYAGGAPVPDGTEILQISPDASSLGRYHAARLAVLGDLRATLDALLPLVRSRVDAAAAAAAVQEATAKRRAQLDDLEDTALGRYDRSPIDPMAAAHALVRALPADAAVVDEAITTGFYVRGFWHRSSPDRYFFCKGGGLGWAMPAALGVSLGRDRAPTLCVVGDGSALYSPQALWTAVREDLPVVFAVVNNRQYLILKNNLKNMKGRSVEEGRYVAMDIEPAVDYLSLARGFGVDATLVEKAGDVGDAVRAALASGRPHVLELPISA